MADTDYAWLAGFLDGEGSFQIVGSRGANDPVAYRAQIVATNTDHRLLCHAREIAGGSVFGPIGIRSKRGMARDAYRWSLIGRALTTMLPLVSPFLVAKREHAAILVALIETMRLGSEPGAFGKARLDEVALMYRRDLKLAVNALNHRGSSPVPAEAILALDRIRAGAGRAQIPARA